MGPIWPALAQVREAPAASEQGTIVPEDVIVSPTESDEAISDVSTEPETALASEPAPEEQVTPEGETALEGEVITDASGEEGTSWQNSVQKNQPKLPEADESTGALVYRYPIEVPPGRNGLQPTLELTYNSQQGEEGSLFGYGWSISIPYIERQNKHGSEQMYARNDFTSSLAGELVDLGSGNFGSKIEGGEFLSYTFTSNVWTVKDKKGTSYIFGSTAGARQDDPGDPAKVFKWMLEEVRDTNDNFIRYEYFKDQGQIYPAKVFYTGSGATDGIFEIEFVRQARADVSGSNKLSFTVTTSYRINQILVKVSGTWARKYDLAYTTADNGLSSLLQSIQESGRDEVTLATVIQPATQFTYGTATKSWTQQGSNWALPNDLFFNRYYDGSDKGGRILDVNGDGLQDLLIAYYYGINDDKRIFLNNGSGWTLSTTWTIPNNVWMAQVNQQGTGTEIADINGDNLPDLLVSFDQGGGNSDKRVYLNNGVDGWVQQTSDWQIPNIFFWQSSNMDPGGRISDINGDGLPDLLIAHYCPSCYPSPTVDQRVYLNNGSGWTQNTAWVFPADFHLSNYYNGFDQGTRLLDLNGDGLLDAVTLLQRGPSTFKKRVYLNTGTGWIEDTSVWTLPDDVVFTDQNSFDKGWRVTDANSDGFPDLYKSLYQSGTTYKKLYLNNGKNGWTDVTSSWTLPNFWFTNYQNGWDAGVRLSDINGDGTEDIVISQHENSGNHVQKVFLHDGNRPNFLTTVTYNTGGATSVTYKPSPLYIDGLTSLNPKLPFVLHTVYQLNNDNGFGTTSTYTYTYEGGEYYYGGPFDRKFAGFGKIIKTDAVGNKTVTYYHQGNETNSALGEYDDHGSKIGYPYRLEQRDAADNVYSVAVTQWDRFDLGSDRSFVKKARQTSMTYDGNATHRDVAETFTYDNANGNMLSREQWGEVTASNDGSFVDIGNDKLISTYTYAVGGSYSVMGLPATELTLDQSGNKVSETRHYYDSLALGSVNKGNETKTEQWIADTIYVDVEKTYNSYGLVTQELDARDKPTTYIYDSYNLYPAIVTKALNQSTQYLYDYSQGKPKQVTDANGAVSQTIYDGLDRVIEQKQSDRSTPSTLVTSATYAYTYLSVGLQTQATKHLDAATMVDVYSYTDGLGRPIQSRVEAETPGEFAVSDVVYNNRGLKEKESLPYFSSGSGRTAAATDPNLYTSYVYDALGRVTSATNAVGTVTYAYDDWKTTVTDSRGNPKHTYTDAYGRLVQVDEVNDASTYTTTYEYNGLGLLTKLTDAAGNIRNFTYDGLARRLTAEDLHAPADSTFGIWSYTYDAAGNLLAKLDPKNQTIVYTYDDLNRVLTEDFDGQAGTEVTYTYDTCTYGVSRLCSVVSADLIEERQYDVLGNIVIEIKTIDNLDYQTDYTYDRQGNQALFTNPDGSQVKNIYNTAGQLEKIERKESTDANFIDVVTNFDYGPHGQVTLQENANGTTTTNTYDAAELYRLRSKITSAPTGDMGMGSAAQFTAAAFYEAAAAPATYDISQTNVAYDYNQAPFIKQTYQLTKAAFVKPAAEADGVRIEVGDVTEDEFTPELHLKRWGDEALFKISPNLAGVAKAQQTLALDGNVIKLQTPKEEYHFYDVAPGVEHPEGAYEFEVVLPKKPRSNVVTLNIETKNLAFYYQSALNAEPQDEGLSCTETQCVDVSGNVVAERPENVVGSYAVYHSTKQGDYSKLGGRNYRSGKAFHIYRPKIIDAKGKWVWGQLSIDAQVGKLSITVPRGFLNAATYPITVDPTFGYTAMGASTGSILAYNSAGTYYSNRIGHPYIGGDGGLDSINVGMRSSSSNGQVVDVTAFLNSRDNLTNNHPQVASIERVGLLVGYNKAWYTFVAAGQTLTSGNIYIISAVADGSDLAASIHISVPTDTVTTLPRYYEQKVGSTGYVEAKENPWSVSPYTYNNYVLSIYATYSPGTANIAPVEPTSLLTEGQINPVNITDTTPEFSAIYNDPNPGDLANRSQVQVSTILGAWTSLVWDSGQQAMAVTPQGTRSPNIPYGGSTLTPGVTYYWRIKFWDDEGAEGAWSTSNSSFSFFSDPNIMVFNSTQGDGYVISSSSSSWDVVHDASVGSGGYPTYTYSNAGVSYYSSNYRIQRSFVPFDTSALPDDAIITDALLKIYVNSKTNNDNDGDDWITIVQTTQAGPQGLITDDYDQAGSVNNPTEGVDTSERKDITNIAYGQYLTFNLNAVGKSWISKTGYTKLGLREGHDAIDAPAAGSDYIQFHSVESYNPPVLQITFTQSNNAPTSPTLLLTEGQTNPVNITDTTPEFSAVYNDPDAGDIANQYQIQVSTSPTDWTSPYWDSGQQAMSATTQGTHSPDISYVGGTLTPGITYYWRIKFWDDEGAEGAWSTETASFSVVPPNNPPIAPTSLQTEGQANPIDVTDTTPEFSAIYNDPDTGDSAVYYQVQVTAVSGNWANLMWDSGQQVMTAVTAGNRSEDISYNGLPLAFDGSTYWWRIKFWDDDNAEGAWSSGNDNFTMSTPPQFQDIQNLTYTYDANGNITRLVDASQTNSAKTVDYTYDDLNRLLTAAAVNVAQGQSTYSYAYTYDAIGNILTRTETIGASAPITYPYSYSSSGYANPHAVTDIAGTAYGYDNNGNLVSRGSALPWYDPAWTDRKQLTVDHTKVSGGADLTDFPMLVSVTDVDLKHTTYGGKVGKTDGTDILFTLSDGLTKLNHELESYTASTGALIAWVRLPVLSTSADTTLIIYYGNDAASDQQNKAGTWNSNYVVVYHNSTGVAGENDSTGSAYNLTEAGTVQQTTAGKISLARQLTSSSTANYLYRADAANLDGLQQMTYQAWIRKTTTSTRWYGIMSKRTRATSQHSYTLGVQSNKVRFITGNAVGNGTDTTTISVSTVPTNTWTAVSAVFDGSQAAASRKKIYLQGTLNVTGTSNITSITNTTSQLNIFRASGQSYAFVGQLDEVRVLKTALSAGWIATEYNNQNSPSTFYTLGSVSGGSQDTYTWDYNNRLATVIPAVAGIQAYTYDSSGQRVKVVSGGVTTVYPTSYYNTDGTTSQKHIMAGGVVATVSGTGAGVVVYTVSTDHLGGTGVVTTITGEPEELVDYYPFGAIRLDEKASSYTEQRKFIGEEYDEATGLNYLNARYYDSSVGRFISQDPLEIVGLQQAEPSKFITLIQNPQNWNTYSYALNNPIISSDPSGFTPYFVPGFAAPGLLRSTAQDSNISQTLSWMTSVFGSQAEFYAWPQQDNSRAFSAAAQGLAEKAILGYTGREPIDLVGHSDGGIVAGKAAQILVNLGFPVRNLIIGGTPVRPGDFDVSGVHNVVMSYNTDDPVQGKGGNSFTVSGLVGGAIGASVFGPFGAVIGAIVGTAFDKGEFGFAGRTLSGAHNFNATSTINAVQRGPQGQRGPIYEHSAPIYEPAVQKQLESYIKR